PPGSAATYWVDQQRPAVACPIFPRWLASGARLLRQRLRLAPGRCDCKGFSPKKRCGSPPRRGLSPAQEALLPCSAPAIGPRGAPRTHSDDLQTAFSVNPSLPPDAAGRSAPESRRTSGGAPPPPPTER